MSSWRERLCGSIVLKSVASENDASMGQILTPNQTLSCGGGFFPIAQNEANMKSFRENFMLPTTKYSVLVFKNDGSAIIYSDDENTVSDDKEGFAFKVPETIM